MGSGACIARIVRIVSCAALLAVALAATPAAAAQPIDNYAMAQVWARLDRPVAEGRGQPGLGLGAGADQSPPAGAIRRGPRGERSGPTLGAVLR